MMDRRRGEGAWGWYDRYLVSNDGLGAQLLLAGITQGGSDCVSMCYRNSYKKKKKSVHKLLHIWGSMCKMCVSARDHEERGSTSQ